MKMTLARALKYRKRVIERLAKVTSQIQLHNSTMEGNKPEISVPETLSLRQQLVDHLLAVKGVISKHNKPIEKEIMLIPELKAAITMFKGILVRDGKEVTGYREKETVWMAQLKQSEIDDKVTDLERQLDETQEVIDKHNYSTMVELPESDLKIW